MATAAAAAATAIHPVTAALYALLAAFVDDSESGTNGEVWAPWSAFESVKLRAIGGTVVLGVG